MTLEECIPQDKFDVAAIGRAEALGFPALNPILRDLFHWTKDMNWPIAVPAVTLLKSAGPEIAPFIIEALRSDDEWTWHLLWSFVGHVQPEVWSAIAAEVERVAQRTAGSEVDEDLFEAATHAIRMQTGAGATG